MTSQADKIALALRAIAPDGKLTVADVAHVNALGDLWEARGVVAGDEPKWITIGRALIGTREIPGPQHNSWIAKGWARLGAKWFNDDETPWCGFFVAHCLDAAGLPILPNGEFARAAAWAGYGVPCAPQLGAIAVKKRTGGNHVFFIVGETADHRYFKALGGNQSNAVSIADIPKADAYAIRWPTAVAQRKIPLPIMAHGTISSNEE